ncbi:MAG: putative porin, partial [Ignavibacterium sp.]|nr:putative porin [Ignavibacterium sp.]
DINYDLIEAAAKFKFDYFSANIKYFINNYYDFNSYGQRFGKVSGIGLNFDYSFLKFLLQSNSSYYTSIDDNKMLGVPEFQTQTGLYYTSKLFNDNLDLKTGFVFYYTGANNVFTNEHGVTEVPSSYKLDFTLAGEIQKVAIVYFLFQNLLDNKYYITPYYPMPARNIRFGFAWELFN